MNKTDGKGTVLITGDFCPTSRLRKLFLEGDYEPVFRDIKSQTENADFIVTNLECPVAQVSGGITKTGPSLSAGPESLEALAYAGTGLVTLANNHIMDYGPGGLRSTIDACRLAGIDYTGAGYNLEEARKIYYRVIGGKMVSFINIAENEFSTTNGSKAGANPLDIVSNVKDISEARNNSDMLIMIFHGGHEFYKLPGPSMKKTLRFFAESGADAIAVHHSHCYSGYEIYKGTPIFYGLGNFLFDNPDFKDHIWNSGYMVELNINNPVDFNLVPYYQCRQEPVIELMKGSEIDIFNNDIESLSAVIADDNLLEEEFRLFCERVKRRYDSFIEPYSSVILHYLRNRGFLPSLLSKRKRSFYLNLMRCESHREVMIHTLGESLKKR